MSCASLSCCVACCLCLDGLVTSSFSFIVSFADRFRRSNDDVLSRAKKRTLKMTITIVLVFLICWTPYYIISMWYWFDRTSVNKISSIVRKSLFIFACTHSCMNPIVYGAFNIRGRLGNNAVSDKFHMRYGSEREKKACVESPIVNLWL